MNGDPTRRDRTLTTTDRTHDGHHLVEVTERLPGTESGERLGRSDEDESTPINAADEAPRDLSPWSEEWPTQTAIRELARRLHGADVRGELRPVASNVCLLEEHPDVSQ